MEPSISGPTRVYPPERRWPRAGRRLAALAAIGLTVAYLAWRIDATLAGATLWLAVWLLTLEAHALLSLVLHTVDLWDVDAAPAGVSVPPGPPNAGHWRVAVLIPTYNEPREVLLPTIAAAVALRPAHQTWVLDDGDRPWVAELATALGARYRARAEHPHAKAGNINAVLPELDVDLVAVFDADHVAHADFLTHTLPYFADPAVALVQTPQEFYNPDSFEHVHRRRGRAFSEQQLFYRALAAGRNRWGAAFWCGTNAVLRLAALRSVGGVATDSVTEDIQTTIRLHRRGWRTVYHNEVLAQGLAAADNAQYLGQRLRWGAGAMQVLRTDNPAFGRGLRPGQRISYLSTLGGWFDSWRTLGYLVLPVATVLTGGVPVAAAWAVFLPWFAVVFCAQRVALALLARGHSTLWYAIVFEVIRLPATLRATLSGFGRRARPFAVTDKGRAGHRRARRSAPPLLWALLGTGVVGLAWYAVTVAGLGPRPYPVPWTAHGAAVWIGLEGVVLVVALRRVTSLRYGADRRAAVRFPVRGRASLGDHPVLVRDISLTGARLLGVAAGRVGQRGTLTLADYGLRLPVIVREVVAVARDGADRAGAGAVRMGVEFDGLPASVAAALALALFRTGVTPDVVRLTAELLPEQPVRSPGPVPAG